MKSYEGLFVFPPEATPDGRKTQIQNLEEAIRKYSGTVVQKVEWGKRPLGYPIRKFREGYFILLDFQMESLRATEFRKAIQLQEDFLNFMITVKTERKEAKKNAAKPRERSPKPVVSHSPSGGSPTLTSH